MTSVPVAAAPMRPVLPSHGVARVKNVLSGDTVVLVGKAATPDGKAPEVVFTFERVTAPRMASKANNSVDDPGAFEAREWLRKLVVGKTVAFETRKQGATAGDRVYGLLFLTNENGEQVNLAVESVRNGHAIPKVFGGAGDTEDENGDAPESIDPVTDYEQQLQAAFSAAQEAAVGVHSAAPLVRTLKTAGEDFETLALVERSQKLCADQRVKCVIEYVFDGSRLRCHITDEQMSPAGMQYGSFTLFIAGITAPRIGNPRLTPPTQDEPFAQEARHFVELRLLHRELDITLHGTDKSGICAVGTIHHPRGNIAVELLKNGLARMSDWSVRMMNPMDVPALRFAENTAKRTNIGIWHSYSPPALSGASELNGTVVEVLTGDTLTILPSGYEYDDDSKLIKISLASIRAPRAGNERMGRPDEPYANECKDRLRVLTVGKPCKVKVAYEKDIPIGENTEKRQFGVVSVGKREDVSEVLVSEGLAVTQWHRDDDETSPRYDELRAAEAVAKAAKKGVHSEKEKTSGRSINDLTDPKKAKSYSGSLMRAGTLKAIVDYVFNGSRFKLYVPSENCHIIFATSYLRCPQPSPMPGSRQVKAAEPFGDASKRHARLTLLQRTVEIVCTGVTNGGVITGDLFIGQGGQRRNYSLELVGAGLATLDQRKIDYGEVPKMLIDAMAAAQNNRVGIWSIEQKMDEKKPAQAAIKSKTEVQTITVSEIRSGNHIYYQLVNDESVKVMNDSMKQFTKNNGTSGAPCDVKPGKIVAALFDDGTGKSWYRGKILSRGERGKVQVLFVDHGNVTTVPVASHLRPLDVSLGTDRIPPVAHEAELALTLTRPISDDEGLDAARMLQKLVWGKELTATKYCDVEGKAQVSLKDPKAEGSTSINEQLVSAGLARVAKQAAVDVLASRMVNSNDLMELAAELNVAQDTARKSRSGMWRYGDIGDEDEEM